MRLRMELFVTDVEVSVAFYREVLGFRLERRGEDYASLRRGQVVLGLGPVAKLPERERVGRIGRGRGAGVEIVFELDHVDEVRALYEHCKDRAVIAEPPEWRPWGLYDFRLTDPDGHYLRVTHGEAGSSHETGRSEMPKFVTIGYGDQDGYDRTDAAVRDEAHAHDARLQAAGVSMGTVGSPVQVRNPDGAGVDVQEGAFMSSALPVAGISIFEADSLEQALEMVSKSPCAVAHGVVEVWPLQEGA